jgi:hypothetical protein
MMWDPSVQEFSKSRGAESSRMGASIKSPAMVGSVFHLLEDCGVKGSPNFIHNVKELICFHIHPNYHSTYLPSSTISSQIVTLMELP